MRMNLLILGNGFDLAHGLNTRYKHFLDWAYDNVQMEDYNTFYWHLYWREKYNLKRKPKTTLVGLPKMFYRETEDRPGFADQLFEDKDNWVDLENNISSIINEWGNRLLVDEIDEKCFKAILNRLIISRFEQYIAEKINNDLAVKLPEFKQVKYANRVLCFNYSNTVERIYDPEAEICYVNGKAILDTESSHIVFGYDPAEDRQGDMQWCEFDKVYQRAYKNTNTRYKEWLKDENNYDIHIVGHSLGQTDSAFLEPFIMKKNSKTIVYYHNLESKRQLIYNMMGIVGRRSIDKEDIVFKALDEFKMREYTPKITVLPIKSRRTQR